MRQLREVWQYLNHFVASKLFVSLSGVPVNEYLRPILCFVCLSKPTTDILSQARYGFFDLDATFSAAFVLVMVGFLDKSQRQPPPALDQAFRVLQFLSQSGNSAAKRRLQDIAQSLSHVWPNHAFNAKVSHSDTAPQDKTQPPIVSPGWGQDALLTSSGSPPYMPVASSSRGDHQDEIRLLEPWSNMDAPDAMFDMQGDWDLDLSGEAEGIYSSFHNPTLPLTGVDYIDWLEIEKVFNGP
jgi:hypothetical protein